VRTGGPASYSKAGIEQTKPIGQIRNRLAEIDIRASYLTLFYAWHGRQLDLTSDPYALPGLGPSGRDVAKPWMVATFVGPKPVSKRPAALLKNYEEDHHKKLDRTRS
jgi:hypothetical protein